MIVAGRLAGEGCYNVARHDAGLRCRAVRLGFGDQDPIYRFVEFETLDDFGVQGLNLDTDPASGDGALFFEFVRDRPYCFRWNGEADADRTACRRKYRTIDANYLAADVEGRSTGIALINRRIDLNEVIVGTKDVTRAGRNNPGRHRSAKSKWVAYCKDPLADPGRLAGYPGSREFVSALYLEQCEVCLRVSANQFCWVKRSIVRGDLDFFTAIDQVIGRQRISVRRYEEARPLIGGDMGPLRVHAVLGKISAIR